MVVTVVHGRMRVAGAGFSPNRAGQEDRAQDRDAVEEEAELGGNVWRCEEEREAADDEARDVTLAARPREVPPSGPARPEGEAEGQCHAENGGQVRPLRVEVALGLDSGQRDGRAEDEGDQTREVGAPVREPVEDDRQDSDRRQGSGEAEEDVGAAGSADEAGVVNLPEHGRRQPPIGHEGGHGGEEEQKPNYVDLA